MFLEMAAGDYAKTNISEQNRQAEISNAGFRGASFASRLPG
jgi:hypothetical protein